MIASTYYIFSVVSVGIFALWLAISIVGFLHYSLRYAGFEGLLYLAIGIFFGFVDYLLWLLFLWFIEIVSKKQYP